MIEEWMNYYSESDIKKIQSILLSLLDAFDSVCNSIHVSYFLYGGSLLGAIKYKGFVPWDDDLDVCLMREDYELLIKEGHKYLTKEYEIQHPRTNKLTPYPYVKFRKKNTALVESTNAKIPINHGIYLDIYPIDNIPDSFVQYAKQKINYDKWVTLFRIRQNSKFYYSDDSKKALLKRSVGFVARFLLKILPSKWYMNKIDSIATKYNDSSTARIGNLSYPFLTNYFFNYEGYDYVLFENRKVKILKGFEVNLKNRYGDIEADPPNNKKIGHRPATLEISKIGGKNAN